MFINRTINKKLLEALIHEIYSSRSIYITEYLLDALKNLGFYYATNSGLSVSIEDLKTPFVKKRALYEAANAINSISEKWERGFVTDAERFQTIIDTWTQLTENLKKQIIAHYQKFDPLNSLYVMSFSGARGNISQVGQLIGMRGLMADQKGQIIDLPIQSNFREGLTSTDYLVSSYGARKGLVDTALKTADAGYLTRRLIYLAQSVTIRLQDCKTTSGVSITIACKEDLIPIFGRTLISSTKNNITAEHNNCFLTPELAKQLRLTSEFPFHLKIRSILTCQASGSVCQVCYGWDLAERSPIALGEAVGIIAAQSIGEPGTQLTMRTFHTGGVFAGEKADHISAPFSGWFSIPKKIQNSNFRTAHGENAIELKEKTSLCFNDWKLESKTVELAEGSILYLSKTGFVKKNQIIGEYKRPSLINTKRRLMPIRTPFSGELLYPHKSINRSFISTKGAHRENKNIIWIASGKIIIFPTQGFYIFPQKLSRAKALGLLKIITPFSGYIELKKSKLFICSNSKKIELTLDAFDFALEGCTLNLSILVKNYQYVDEQSVVALIYIFPKEEGEVYSCKKKSAFFINAANKIATSNFLSQEESIAATSELFFITNADIWTLCMDQVNYINFNTVSHAEKRSGEIFNKTIKSGNSGFFLHNCGLCAYFQNAYPIFLGAKTRLSCQEWDFIFNKQIIASQIRTTLRTEDIVQGIPKVSALIEAHQSKAAAVIAPQTGLLYELAFDCTDRPEIKAKSFNYLHRTYNVKRCEQTTDKLLQLRARVHQFKAKKSKNRFCITTLNENFSLEPSLGFALSCLPKAQLSFQKHLSFVIAGQQVTEGPVDPHELLSVLLKNESNGSPLINQNCDGSEKIYKKENYIYQLAAYPAQVQRALTKFRTLLANSLLGIYYSQGVTISSKHLELITSQLTSKVVIKSAVGTIPANQFGFYDGEIVDLALAVEIYNSYLESENEHDRLWPPIYVPKYSSATRLSGLKDGFLASAAFQETKKALTKAAIFGKCDWLRNLKENIIVGRAIPAGTTYFNFKNSLGASSISSPVLKT